MELDGAASADTYSTEMEVLYNFLTRVAGPRNLVPNCGKDSIILSKLLSGDDGDKEDKYEPSDSDMGRLVMLFDKYLQLRLSPEDFPEDGHNGVLKFVLESMFASYVDESEDFKIKHLWELEKAALKFRSDAFGVAVNAKSAYGRDHNIEVFKSGDIKYATYFGEFLYFCSAKIGFKSKGISYIDKIRETATTVERRILKELSLTPQLGISTFLVYRNWVFDAYPMIRDGFVSCWEEIEAVKGLEPFHNSYCELLEKVNNSNSLSTNLSKIGRFLVSKASPVHRLFNYNVISSEEFLTGLSNKDYVLKLDTQNRYLLRLYAFLLDALLFLKNSNDDTLNYKDIPKYFKNCWSVTSDTPVSHIQVYLFEASQLLDLVFVEYFKTSYLEEYVGIYRECNNVIGDNFSSLVSVEPSLKMNSLFLFYGMDQ